MLNVNKLTGIVKGIDFDRVVNEKEFDRLQLWADRSRNLAVTKDERAIVRAVDAVLEDGVITKEEIEQLLEACNALHGPEDVLSRLYELSGLVDGILCDGVLNEKEVRALNTWLGENEFLAGHEVFETIKKLVDDVLEDDVVTFQEEIELKKALEQKMKEVRFQHGLSNLRRKVQRKELVGLDLIEILDNENAIKKIHSLAEDQLMSALNSYTGLVRDKEIVFISAALIGLLEYNGSYYNGVQDTYKVLYRFYTKAKIENLIRETLSHFQVKWDDDYEGRIINIALMNAIVPMVYLPAFFDFIYDIYRLNLEYALSDDLEDDFGFAYEGLYEKMVNGGDNLSVETTNKTYKLIRTTKDVVVAEDYRQDIVKLSAMVAKIIDEHVWKNDVRLHNPYLKYGYEQWAASVAKDEVTSRRRRRQHAIRSQWEPRFELHGTTVYLRPPDHRIKDCYDYRDISICVYNGTELLKSARISDLRQIIGGYKCCVEPIAIDRPLGQIRYRITAKNDVIYDSGERLYRQILAFGLSGSEIKNNTDFEGTAVICYAGVSDLEPYHQAESYKLAAYDAKTGDTLVAGDAAFNFSSITKPGVLGVCDHRCAIEAAGSIIPVYTALSYIVFEAESDVHNFEISLSGKAHRLDDFAFKTFDRPGFRKYILDAADIEPGIHDLKIFSLIGASKKKLLAAEFAYDPTLSVRQSNDEADDESVAVEVESALLDEPFAARLDLTDFDEDWLTVRYKGLRCPYRINLDINLYRIDTGPWHRFSEEIWGGDVTSQSKLEIYGNRFTTIDILSERLTRLDTLELAKTARSHRQAGIGSLLSYKAENDTITLKVEGASLDPEKISVRNRCAMLRKDVEFLFDPSTADLSVTWAYAGRGKVQLSIIDKAGNEAFRSELLPSQGEIVLPRLASFETYTFRFFEKPAGLSLGGNRTMLEIERSFCAWDDLPGRAYRLSKACFDQMFRGEFVRKSRNLAKDYVLFRERIENDEFEGCVFTQEGASQSLLRHIGLVGIEICGSTPDGLPILSITKDGDGLLLNAEEDGVLDSLDDPNAPDIISFITQEY